MGTQWAVPSSVGEDGRLEGGGGVIILVKGNFKDFLCSKLCYVFALKLVVATSVADPYNFDTDLIII